ncbi:MAG: helicase-exonuclease AddAB subunit AddA [Verrucomicrobiota bacterium]
MSQSTPQQQQAVEAQGNILVIAGAGAGKTRTLVQRCLAFLLDEKNPGSLDEILMVTFTEAAAAEMKKRIRAALEEKLRSQPEDTHLAEQLALLDSARICTLHSFCFQLIREHFYDLQLDPQVKILPEEQSTLLAREALDALMGEIYAGENSFARASQELIAQVHRGWDLPMRELVLRLHAYTQTLSDPAGWIEEQRALFQQTTPTQWEKWLLDEIPRWKNAWLDILQSQESDNTVAQICAQALSGLSARPDRTEAATVFQKIFDAEAHWTDGKKTVQRKPMEKLFSEADFLHSLCAMENGVDPLLQDWNWTRPQAFVLLELATQFARHFREAKLELGALDFHDLEQSALELLWNRQDSKPTAIAERWRRQLRHVMVDEYQDINAAQDTILRALAREGSEANRFLVGDVKQSIYRFRLANPRIFLDYSEAWKHSPDSFLIPLSDNFRSHEAILNFVNPLFAAVMKKDIGGIHYDTAAQLTFGNRAGRAKMSALTETSPRVELHLRITGQSEESGDADAEIESLSKTGKEARLLARRLSELKNAHTLVWKEGGQQPMEWSDIVILLRSPRGKAEAFAKEFAAFGIPLAAPRGGFYESIEVSDLLNLLRLLDNPLQDLPLLAVLRSPFLGLSPDDLAGVRMTNRHEPLWTALGRWRELNASSASTPTSEQKNTFEKVETFLQRFVRWRKLKKQKSLSQLLETVLDETHYADWLRAQERGAQRHANVEQLLALTRQFDSLQGQGLFRFLRTVEAQKDAEIDLEPARAVTENAVRLMSIHQSKGLEFPIVAVADLSKPFNFGDAREKVILDEIYGLCPQVLPPETRQTYPSLPHWLAQRRQKTETLGEELRLLYVALTRAVDRLILCGSATEKTVMEKWPALAEKDLGVAQISSAKNFLDWIGLWLAQTGVTLDADGQNALLAWTIYGENDSRLVLQNPTEGLSMAESEGGFSPEKLHQLEKRIRWSYPFQPATVEPAKTSVSALRRRADLADEDATTLFGFRRKTNSDSLVAVNRELTSSEIGTAHHIFLEFVSLDVCDEKSFRAEAVRLQQSGILTKAETAALNFSALAAFWSSALGIRIREQKQFLRREHPFTLRLSAEDFETLGLAASTGLKNEFVVVQGVIDLAVILPQEIWLLDFKTDEIPAAELAERGKYYQTQIALYAKAMGEIYRRPVTNGWLHFLALQKTVAAKTD